jgi:hypothetical protein
LTLIIGIENNLTFSIFSIGKILTLYLFKVNDTTLYLFKVNDTTLYHFKVNDTTLYHFKVNDGGNSYKQFYDISEEIL